MPPISTFFERAPEAAAIVKTKAAAITAIAIAMPFAALPFLPLDFSDVIFCDLFFFAHFVFDLLFCGACTAFCSAGNAGVISACTQFANSVSPLFSSASEVKLS